MRCLDVILVALSLCTAAEAHRAGVKGKFGIDTEPHPTWLEVLPHKGSGKNVKIYVLDSGIERKLRSQKEGRVVYLYDATRAPGKEECNKTKDDDCAVDFTGAGTFAAGLMGDRTAGVAPDVTLVSVKVWKNARNADFEKFAVAMYYTISQVQEEETAVIYIGAPRSVLVRNRGRDDLKRIKLFSALLRNAADQGLTVVLPAGSTELRSCDASRGDEDPAIVVGNTDEKGMKPRRHYGCGVDVWAPSRFGAIAPYGKTYPQDAAQAAAYVAGYAALILDVRPWESPVMVRHRIKQSQAPGRDAIRVSTVPHAGHVVLKYSGDEEGRLPDPRCNLARGSGSDLVHDHLNEVWIASGSTAELLDFSPGDTVVCIFESENELDTKPPVILGKVSWAPLDLKKIAEGVRVGSSFSGSERYTVKGVDVFFSFAFVLPPGVSFKDLSEEGKVVSKVDAVSDEKTEEVQQAENKKLGKRKPIAPSASWGLNLMEAYPHKGSGKKVKIFVVDSGIDYRNAEFGGRATPFYDATRSEGEEECSETDLACAADKTGRGTLAAGLIGGRTSGVAPEVSLLSVKVWDKLPDVSATKFSKAMLAVLAKAEKPAAIYVGLTRLQLALHYKQREEELVAIFKKAVSEGLSVVLPAGENRRTSCDTFGIEDSTIAVGSVSTNGMRFWRSDQGQSCVDVMAPGTSELSARLHSGGTFSQKWPSAAGYVAGYVALILDARPQESPAMVRHHLKASKVPMKDYVKVSVVPPAGELRIKYGVLGQQSSSNATSPALEALSAGGSAKFIPHCKLQRGSGRDLAEDNMNAVWIDSEDEAFVLVDYIPGDAVLCTMHPGDQRTEPQPTVLDQVHWKAEDLQRISTGLPVGSFSEMATYRVKSIGRVQFAFAFMPPMEPAFTPGSLKIFRRKDGCPSNALPKLKDGFCECPPKSTVSEDGKNAYCQNNNSIWSLSLFEPFSGCDCYIL